MSESPLHILFAPLETILPLRQAVIIAGTNRDSPYFPGDDAPDTRHVAALDNGVCLGCATVLRSNWNEQPAWQLRGMAVSPEQQRRGIGRALLTFLERELPGIAPGIGIWCNARAKAAPFYTKAGFLTCSDPFHIENVGPHFRLFKPFPATQTNTLFSSPADSHPLLD